MVHVWAFLHGGVNGMVTSLFCFLFFFGVTLFKDPEKNCEPVDASTNAAISACTAATRIKAALEQWPNGKLKRDQETGMVADVAKLI